MSNLTNSTNTSNFFRKPRKGNSRSSKIVHAKPTGFHNPWKSSKALPSEKELKRILFLSKRGMTRSPVAREVMRSLIEKTEWFGKSEVLSAGVTKAYDDCPIDQRMKAFCKGFGYDLQTRCSFAEPRILRSANFVVTLDRESEQFAGLQQNYVDGETYSLGTFLTQGSEPYLPDPYDRNDDLDVDERYEEIISSIEYGCAKLNAKLIGSLG